MKTLNSYRSIPSLSTIWLGFLTGFTVLIVLSLQGCGGLDFRGCAKWKPADTLQVGHEDPFHFVHNVKIDSKGRATDHRVVSLRPGATRIVAPDKLKPEPKPVEKKELSKIHPLLQKWMKSKEPQEVVEVLIRLEDSLKIPRFPELAKGAGRESKEAKRVMALRSEVIEQIAKLRKERQSQFIQRATRQLGKSGFRSETVGRFWLTNTILAKIQLKAIEKLAEDKEVVYVQPRFAEEKPPQDANPDNDLADGCTRIVSNPYFNLGLTRGWIGLLDTGVRTTQTVFNSPARLGFVYDCVNGGANCNNTAAAGYDPSDDCWDHGTQSASIISGNGNLGAAYRGVTAITLDSIKVYGSVCGGLDSAATVRGFERAIEILDSVIVAEMQASEGDQGTIAKAAENAFDAGAIIIAANGNFGSDPGSVRSPANAHKVIGVGSYNVESLATLGSQGRGPTSDDRIKPDIQAPSQTETPNSSSDTSVSTFGGTSGATPYAAGAAGLFRNWFRQFGTYDPGQVYAFMILAGEQPSFNNEEGAGDLRMPVNGWAWWGKLSVSDGSNTNISINVPAGIDQMDVAIWWPQASAWWEGLNFSFIQLPILHNDIDLRLRNTSGTTVASSLSVSSIFEKVRYTGHITPGNWTIRIRGYRVRSAPQTVYWVAPARY